MNCTPHHHGDATAALDLTLHAMPSSSFDTEKLAFELVTGKTFNYI